MACPTAQHHQPEKCMMGYHSTSVRAANVELHIKRQERAQTLTPESHSWPVKLPTGSTACQTSVHPWPVHFTCSSDSRSCTTTTICKPRERQLYSIQTRTRHTPPFRQPKPEYTQKIHDNEKNKILL